MTQKLLFTGYYGFNNFGDDLFGLACINGLVHSRSNFQPIILAPPIHNVNAKFLVPKFLASLYKNRGLPGTFLRVFFMIYGCIRCRNVVLSGGSVISSAHNFHMRLIQRILVKFKVCRLSAIGVSVGPFNSDKDKIKAKKLLNNLQYLSVRDEESLHECERLGLNIDVHLHNDLAGCVQMPPKLNAEKVKNVLGVSICRYESITGGDVKKEKLRNLSIFQGICEFSIKHNFKLRIVVLNSNQSMGDVQVSQGLYDYAITRGVPVEILNYDNPLESLTYIQECEIFFSVRLHGAICAYLLDVPFVLVEYHRKCKDFLDYIGLDKKNRVPGNVANKETIINSLELVLNGHNKCALSSKEYIKKSTLIFSNSPWAL